MRKTCELQPPASAPSPRESISGWCTHTGSKKIVANGLSVLIAVNLRFLVDIAQCVLTIALGVAPGWTERIITMLEIDTHKPCYGKCDRCVWKYNGGCSEWDKRLINEFINKEENNSHELD